MQSATVFRGLFGPLLRHKATAAPRLPILPKLPTRTNFAPQRTISTTLNSFRGKIAVESLLPKSRGRFRFASSGADSAPEARNTFAGLLVFIFPGVTFFLGAWQVYRLQWKLDLIEDTEMKLHDPPVPLPADLSPETASGYEYKRVRMTGHFNHKKEIHLGPRSRGDGDVGFYIVTPFITTGPDGKEWTVLVNRGFVPRAIKDAPLRPESLPNGTFTIEGLIRKGERNSVGLLTKVNTAKNMWTWMDLKTAGEWTGAKDFFLVEMVQGSLNNQFKLPEPRAAYVNFKNNHLQYAITWFGLSAASAALLWKGRQRGGSLRRRARPLR